ncbi:hypothetical protein GCM10010965_26860 [Caldalkalibacillus thermarum]|nr:hypothetical protein GCM10010965_26860 [Caldalkalibacillus thermarum]
MAISGGVNVLLSPEMYISFSQAGMMAPDGRCKTFDEKADGYVRGEGCGVVLLKRLDDAIADGDRIYAVIKGSAVNQDGHSNGLTAPRGPAQAEVIQTSLQRAGLRATEVSYIEAHGTGTALGDAIEVNTLKSVLVPGRKPEQRCALGSIKTNIGHLEAAAGIAGLIKVALMLKHKVIPPHLHVERLNHNFKIDETPLFVPTEKMSWSWTENRVAGVSSFGFGGTNAHVTVVEYDSKRLDTSFFSRSRHVLALSAKDPRSLQEQVRKYVTYLEKTKENIADICYTTNAKREHFAHRLAVTLSSKAEGKKKLQRWLQNQKKQGDAGKAAALIEKSPAPIVFLYSGQGSQYLQMGYTLFKSQPVFREAILKCATYLKSNHGLSILDILYTEQEQESKQIHQTANTQPILFAIQYALTELWKSFGITPDYVVGHSIGEYAAAVAAGMLSLEDALSLVALRGKLMQQTDTEGAMLAVRASESDIKAYLVSHDKIDIAAVNTPSSVVVSGVRSRLEALAAKLEQEGIEAKFIEVSRAFHSPLMDSILDEFKQYADQVNYTKPNIPFISSLTGTRLSEGTSAKYWTLQIREKVLFKDCMDMFKDRKYIFIEMGAGQLIQMAKSCLGPQTHGWITSLNKKDQDDWKSITTGLAMLYEAGYKIDWEGFDQSYQRTKVGVPTYAFSHKSYWDVATHPVPLSNDKGNVSNEWLSIIEKHINTINNQGKVLNLCLNNLPSNYTRDNS